MTLALVGRIEPGVDAYLAPQDAGWGTPADWERSWSFGGELRTVKRRDGGYTKSWARWDAHTDADTMIALLAEIAARGIDRPPSGYGDLFHRLHATPPVQAHVRKLVPHVPGGWEMALTRGECRQPLYQYDLRSAYLWSLAQHLPSPHSFVTTRRVTGPGVYLVESPARLPLPYPWYLPGYFPATEEEISALNLNHRSVTRGIAFEPDSWRAEPWVASIQRWSCWKQTARAFWGRWAGGGRTRQTTYCRDGAINTEREIRDPCTNPVWAALITARIRLRLWDIVWRQPVQRVYVDSVVTTAPLESGDRIGDWREVRYYPRGGYVTLSGVLGRSDRRG